VSNLRLQAFRYLNSGLRRFGFKILKASPTGGRYLSAQETIAAAEASGLSVDDYLEIHAKWAGFKTSMSDALDHFLTLRPCIGKATSPLRVVEIGPGTGRAIELLLTRLKIDCYHIYERDEGWSQYLVRKFAVTACPCDGETLRGESSSSLDLAHAHYVFVYLSFLNAVQYLREIGRVLRPGGTAWCDFYIEDNFGEEEILEWLSSEDRFPVLWSRRLLTEQLARAGLHIVAEYPGKIGTGTSTYFIVEKK
jgi:SAM-dependent methyltransferase